MAETGALELRAKLLEAARRVPRIVGAALYQEALIETKESARRTPVDTGALRASHETAPPVYAGSNITVTITVGGPTAPYALIVHEDLNAHHPVGQAKFLESTLNESAPFIAERLGRRIRVEELVP